MKSVKTNDEISHYIDAFKRTDMAVKAIREYIENAIDIVVNISRLSDGRRKVTSICEVDGFKDDMIELKEIFNFKQTGLTSNGEVEGAFDLKKRVPFVYKKIKSKGIDDLDDIFNFKK